MNPETTRTTATKGIKSLHDIRRQSQAEHNQHGSNKGDLYPSTTSDHDKTNYKSQHTPLTPTNNDSAITSEDTVKLNITSTEVTEATDTHQTTSDRDKNNNTIHFTPPTPKKAQNIKQHRAGHISPTDIQRLSFLGIRIP